MSETVSRAFVVPCATLAGDAPWRWLKLGWRDWQQSPRLSLLFGVVIMLISVVVSLLAWKLGRFALLAVLLSGFIFIAPLIAVGLYSVSRRWEQGQTPRLSDSLVLVRRIVGQAGVFTLIQFVILLIWSRAGMMLNAFFPIENGQMDVLIPFLMVGSAIGSVFASVTFASAVFALPMIADRETDMITASVSSINAVLRNKWVCLKWASIIVVLTGLGFLTAFLGLVVIMPWLAYAAWHGYRETLDASDWPQLP